MGEMIHLLTEKCCRDLIRYEKQAFRFYIMFMGINMICLPISLMWYDVLEANELVVCIMLIITVIVLVKQLKFYHYIEYLSLKNNIWVFLWVEIICILFNDVINFSWFQNQNTEFWLFVTGYEWILLLAGLYPIQQALCMYYIKSVQDPLQLIAKLDAVCLVSSMETKTREFQSRTKETPEYLELQEDQKELLQCMFDEYLKTSLNKSDSVSAFSGYSKSTQDQNTPSLFMSGSPK